MWDSMILLSQSQFKVLYRFAYEKGCALQDGVQGTPYTPSFVITQF
jgi:hypothetical protein